MHQLFPGVRSRKTRHVRPTTTEQSSVKYRRKYGIAVFLKIWQMSISETTVKYVARSFLCRTRCDLAVERTLNCRGGIVLPYVLSDNLCFFRICYYFSILTRAFYRRWHNWPDYLSAERGIFNFVKFPAWTSPSSDPIMEYSIFGLFTFYGSFFSFIRCQDISLQNKKKNKNERKLWDEKIMAQAIQMIAEKSMGYARRNEQL